LFETGFASGDLSETTKLLWLRARIRESERLNVLVIQKRIKQRSVKNV